MLLRVLVCTLALAICGTSALAQDARKAVSKPTPHYPEIAKRMNLVGTVKIEIVVGQDGKIKGTNVLGGHPVLVDSALMALKEWRYEPGTAETTVLVSFDFKP
jgi:TonB family protein